MLSLNDEDSKHLQQEFILTRTPRIGAAGLQWRNFSTQSEREDPSAWFNRSASVLGGEGGGGGGGGGGFQFQGGVTFTNCNMTRTKII